jgi:16S rRNA (guanine527-N7)-methyltransferase
MHGASARRVLEAGFEELETEVGDQQLEQLLELSLLLAHWAERINLTAHRHPDAIAQRLILDAAALLGCLPEFESIADLGSGAGFPGLPIAILSPARVTLVEAREKRHHFQRAAIRQLGLENALARRGRIEDLAPSPHQAVVAQAVGPWSDVVGWMIPWAEPDGMLVLPAGREVPSKSPDQRAVNARVLRYQVPLGGPERQVWLARRSAERR